MAEHPRVRLHFTPTNASWLNPAELCFAKIEPDLLARGLFTSAPDLARKLRRYIRHCNKNPTPVQWTHADPRRRIVAASSVTGH